MEENSFDNVSRPYHYASGDIECIDAMIAAKGLEKVEAFCELNAFKYIWRCDKKNGTEDLEKARWYIDKAIDLSARMSLRRFGEYNEGPVKMFDSGTMHER